MFDKLVDLLVQFVDLFKFVRFVYPWQRGIVLRLGNYARTVEPGWRFVAPFHIEQLMTEHVVVTTTNLPAQSLTTEDGVSVVVGAVVTWHCADVKKLLLEVEGRFEAVADTVLGVVASCVAGTTWDGLTSEAFLRRVTRLARVRAKRYGIAIDEVAFSDLARCRSLRLFGGGAGTRAELV